MIAQLPGEYPIGFAIAILLVVVAAVVLIAPSIYRAVKYSGQEADRPMWITLAIVVAIVITVLFIVGLFFRGEELRRAIRGY